MFWNSYFFNKPILRPYGTQNSFTKKKNLNGKVLFYSGLFWFNVVETQLTLALALTNGGVIASCAWKVQGTQPSGMDESRCSNDDPGKLYFYFSALCSSELAPFPGRVFLPHMELPEASHLPTINLKFSGRESLCYELNCPLKIRRLKFWPSVPQNFTLFGNRVIEDVSS